MESPAKALNIEHKWLNLPQTIPAALIFSAGLYFLSVHNYLLYHAMIELFAAVVAFTIFSIGWNTRKYSQTNILVILAVGYLVIGITDVLHTLAFKGMGVFTEYDSNLPTQLWIAGRYLEALTMLGGAYYLGRDKLLQARYLLVLALVLASGLLIAIFTGYFPDCFIEGQGLTTFKVASEYVISLLLLVAAFIFYIKRSHLSSNILKLLLAAITLTILSEMSFTLYVDVYGFFNYLGHIFKLFSVMLIYKALIDESLNNPFQLLFKELSEAKIQLQAELLKIKAAEEELEQRVHERTAELEASNKELESFAYSISHDFRAPLRALNAFSANLTEKYNDQLDEQGLHYLNRINKASLYMSDLVDDLLKLTRITRADVNSIEVDISSLARKRLKLKQEKEPERRVKVEVAPGLSAKGDIELLEDALEYLIDNAWKFSSKEAQAKIEVGRTTIDGEEAFFVRDNGVGFNMAYADKLFGIFQRLHGVNEFPGTGIGLASVQRIISLHGGRIWAESEVGKGATFYFTLPE